MSEYSRQYYQKNREKILIRSKQWNKHSPYKFSPSRRFGMLMSRCRHYKRDCSITLEQYKDLILQPCFYCNGPLEVQGCGLDRIDSTQGYTQTNSRPCCMKCNQAKNNLTETEFRSWLQRISEHYL